MSRAHHASSRRPGAARPAAGLCALAVSVALLVAGQPAAAAARPPSVSAKSAILVETSTGDVLFEKRAGVSRPIASTTKLMTALLALERAKLGDVFTAARYNPLPVESVIRLRAGERLTVSDLLTGLLLASANDAAVTLAQNISGSRPAFVRLMNRRARALGLTGTSYSNPIGLDSPDNYSTAADLVKLALLLRRNAFFRRTVDRRAARLLSGSHPRDIRSRNLLLGADPAVNGVKTGHTRDAGYVLVGSATRKGVTVVSAVLADPSEGTRDADSLALLRYGLRSYLSAALVRRGQIMARVGVDGYDKRTTPLAAFRTVTKVRRRGERPQLVVDAPDQLKGPLPAGVEVGTVTLRLRGKVVGHSPLVTAEAVPAPSFGERVVAFMTRPATLALFVLLACAGAVLILRRRRATRRQVPAKRPSRSS